MDDRRAQGLHLLLREMHVLLAMFVKNNEMRCPWPGLRALRPSLPSRHVPGELSEGEPKAIVMIPDHSRCRAFRKLSCSWSWRILSSLVLKALLQSSTDFITLPL